MPLKIATLLGENGQPRWFFCRTDRDGGLLNRYAVAGCNFDEQRASARELGQAMKEGGVELLRRLGEKLLLGEGVREVEVYDELLVDQTKCIVDAQFGQTVDGGADAAYFAEENEAGERSLAEVLLDLGDWLVAIFA